MPWGYRSKASYSRSGGGGTTAWNTAGSTASLSNACAQYDLTEEQVAASDPAIQCQWRSCHGNSYAVVKLSDMAELKKRLRYQAQEAKKQKLIDELGEEGYKAKVKADVADAAANIDRENAARSLRESLEAAIAASGNGIAPTLNGIAIGKTAAKKEWYVDPHKLESLSPVDPSKKLLKYHLADVIRLAHNKGGYSDHIRVRIKTFPARQKLYARFLHDNFLEQRSKAETLDDSEKIIQIAYDSVRGSIDRAVESKAKIVQCAQDELAVEESRLAAFDDLVGGMESNDSGENKPHIASAAVSVSLKKKAISAVISVGVDGNAENDYKKPVAKKRKVATKKGLASKTTDGEVAATTRKSTRSRRNNNPVSYAEENVKDEE